MAFCDVIVNFLRARLSIDPRTYLVKGKIAKCGHWEEICDDCWFKVLEIPNLIIERLHKDTWNRALDMFGTEQERKNFVKEYRERYFLPLE